MRKKNRGSKRRAVSSSEKIDMDHRNYTENYADVEQKSEERVAILREGTCKVGICGSDAACQPYPNNTYTCLCPHDSAPPTANGRCPRYTVPLLPHRIPNIRPPEDNPADAKNMTKPTNHNTTSWIPPAESSYSGRKTDSTNLIIAASVVSTIIFFLIIILWRKRKRCGSREKSSPSPSPIVLKRSLLVAERYAPNPQYSACTGSAVPVLRRETLKFLNEIGEGCFGKVFKGELHTENDSVEVVAIKVLKETASREAEEDFLREVDIMSAFRHSNILPLLGVVLRDSNVTPMMVFEYMPHGDLAEVLRGQRKHTPNEENLPNLTSKDLLSIALQIANGMKYLAAQRFVHRDLACRNCLVADSLVVKIADFGMSRDVYTCDYYKIGGSRLLPVRWMSPESVMYGRFTLESDIWSYGVVLWEIYSFGKQPYYGHTNEEVVKLILQGIMLIPPEDCPSLICELMKCCWKTEPRDRIKFADIYHKLVKAYENFEEPIKTFENTNTIKFENEFGSIKSFGSLRSCDMKKLPRPPPLPIISHVDLLDKEGYLLPKEIKEPVQYLQALPD